MENELKGLIHVAYLPSEHRWANVITPERAFGLAADLLLGLMQQSPNNQPTANDIAKLFEKFKRLSRNED